jgi:PAP2 superfamily
MSSAHALSPHLLAPISAPHRLSLFSVVVWLVAVDAVWARLAALEIAHGYFLGGYIVIVVLLTPFAFRWPRQAVRLRETLLTLAGLVAFSAASALLSYLAVSAKAPLIDTQLASIDQALGFDWSKLARGVAHFAWLSEIFWWAYRSAILQIIVVVVVLGCKGQLERMREFTTLFVVGGLFCIGVSGFVPALGPWHAADPALFDRGMVWHFEALRSGALPILEIGNMQGLVSMPSFHAMSAVFLAHAMRGLKGWSSLFIALNAFMIAATPTEGGHYLIDVLAGIAGAIAFIALFRFGLPLLKEIRNEQFRITTG